MLARQWYSNKQQEPLKIINNETKEKDERKKKHIHNNEPQQQESQRCKITLNHLIDCLDHELLPSLKINWKNVCSN